jgi:hypothetical protein
MWQRVFWHESWMWQRVFWHEAIAKERADAPISGQGRRKWSLQRRLATSMN